MVYYEIDFVGDDCLRAIFERDQYELLMKFLEGYFPIEMMLRQYTIDPLEPGNKMIMVLQCEPMNIRMLQMQLDALTIRETAKEANFHPN